MRTLALHSIVRRDPENSNTPNVASSVPAPAPEAASTGGHKVIVACAISENCQNQIKDVVSDYKYLACPAQDYFACVCSRANSLAHNAYFSSHCVFEECTDEDNKRAFIQLYKKGCEARKLELIDIPPEWAPFAQAAPRNPGSREALKSSTPASTSLNLTLTSAEASVSVSASAGTSPSPPISTAAAASKPISKASIATVTTSVIQMASKSSHRPSSPATPTTSVAPSTSYGPGLQFPICGIPPKCMKPNNPPKCDSQDFQCICRASNSLANNTQFDQQCVINGCAGEIGKEEFLDYLIYQCRQANTTLVDIPEQWEPYLPSNFAVSAPAGPSASPLVLTTPPSQPALSDGAIAGIAVGVLAALFVLATLGIAFYRAKKKVREVQKRNAELVDHHSAHGVTAYIRKTIGRSTTSLPVSENGTVLVGRGVQGGDSPVLLSEGGTGLWGSGSKRADARGGEAGYAEHIRSGAQGVYPQPTGPSRD